MQRLYLSYFINTTIRCVLNQSKKKKIPPSITKEKNNTQIKTNKQKNPTLHKHKTLQKTEISWRAMTKLSWRAGRLDLLLWHSRLSLWWNLVKLQLVIKPQFWGQGSELGNIYPSALQTKGNANTKEHFSSFMYIFLFHWETSR